jgi:hypothetical protein
MSIPGASTSSKHPTSQNPNDHTNEKGEYIYVEYGLPQNTQLVKIQKSTLTNETGFASVEKNFRNS